MRKMKIDFSGVEQEIREGGSRLVIPGDYICKINKVELKYKENDRSNPPYFSWEFRIIDGDFKGVPLWYITSLKTDALWNLRNLIYAARGRNVAGKSLDFDPEMLIGDLIQVSVENEEYQGKMKNRAISVTRPPDDAEVEEDVAEDDDEEPTPPKAKAKKATPPPPDDDDEELEDVDLDEEL